MKIIGMKRKLRSFLTFKPILLGLSVLVFLTACSDSSGGKSYPTLGTPSKQYTYEEILWPEQPGNLVYQAAGFVLDYSNAEFGYLSIKAPVLEVGMKAQVIKGEDVYTYSLVSERYVIVPLQSGDGEYQVKLLKQKDGNTYAVSGSVRIDVVLVDDFTTYLYPNQIVDYNKETLALMKSFELTETAETDLERVFAIYTYITDNIDYDYDKAIEAQTRFILPIIDETYLEEKGICFDYASLMTAMLRVQHIPTRVVTGMVKEGYHAWVEVYVEDVGWINPNIYFEEDWERIDPTFDAIDTKTTGYDIEDVY